MTHEAIYGNVTIPRVWCRKCRGWTLILEGLTACCETQHKPTSRPIGAKRMCEPGDNRRKLSRKQKREIMAAQSNRCAYCLTTFGSVVYWRKRNVRLQIEWDHLVPFAYNRDNRPANFVAACHICNRIKSSLLFQTMDEARAYIQARRDR